MKYKGGICPDIMLIKQKISQLTLIRFGGGYNQLGRFSLLLFLLLVSSISIYAGTFCTAVGFGINAPFYSLDEGRSYPLSEFIEPVGFNARGAVSHEVCGFFSYGLMYRYEYLKSKPLVYNFISSSDIMVHATGRIPAAFMEIPITFAIGGHFEFLGGSAAYGMTALFETGLDFFLTEHNLLGFRTGLGTRMQWIGGSDSYTFTVYPLTLLYTYRF